MGPFEYLQPKEATSMGVSSTVVQNSRSLFIQYRSESIVGMYTKRETR